MNPYAVGLASVGVIGLLVGLAFMVGVYRLLEDAYTVRAVFSDASGLRSGDEVRVAGVKVGRVSGVEADHQGGTVVVELKVNQGVHLGPQPTAEIALETLLGAKYVRLGGKVAEPYFHERPARERVIPLARTRTPFDVFELTRVATRTVQETDTDQLNRFVTQLADVTEGKQAQVRALLEGLDRFSTALAERDAELDQLLARAAEFSTLLAEKDQTIVALVDQSEAVLELIARRRSDVAAALRHANAALSELAAVVRAHEANLDFVLGTLHPAVGIVERRQGDLDRSLAWLGEGALGLAQAGTHGPWEDIYVRSLGPDLILSLEATLGSQQ
jgi:phospholipid/cholesterol/gamma-HCH transport system substrate-binding protein